MRHNGIDYYLSDDGTLDTVISVWCGDEEREYRYDMEFAAEYRDPDGYLNFEQFVTDVVIDDAEGDFDE